MSSDTAYPFLKAIKERYQSLLIGEANLAHINPLDNATLALRCISQRSNFWKLAAISNFEPLQICLFFLAEVELVISDTSFIAKGASNRLKTAYNYCVIITRICEVLCDKQPESYALRQEMVSTLFTVKLRHRIIMMLKGWHEVLSGLPKDKQESQSTHYFNLDNKIGGAISAILFFEPPFTDVDVKSGIIKWLSTIEESGFKVFTPKLLCRYDGALGKALSNSYARIGNYSPHCFTTSIFEQVLPSLRDGPAEFINKKGFRMTFAEEFLWEGNGLPFEGESKGFTGEIFKYPDILQEDASKLHKNLGSLLFFGSYMLT